MPYVKYLSNDVIQVPVEKGWFIFYLNAKWSHPEMTLAVLLLVVKVEITVNC